MVLPWDNPERPVQGMSLDGGLPCLDLLNTLRPAIPTDQVSCKDSRDLLFEYEDLLALAVRTAVLPAVEADSLQARVVRDPSSASLTLGKTREFRALLRRIIAKIIRKESPSARDLASFEALRTEARSLEVLVWEDGRFRLRPRYLAEGFEAPLLALVRDADEFLRSPDVVRIRIVRINTPEARFTLS